MKSVTDSLVSGFGSLTTGLSLVLVYKENPVRSDNHTSKVLSIDD